MPSFYLKIVRFADSKIFIQPFIVGIVYNGVFGTAIPDYSLHFWDFFINKAKHSFKQFAERINFELF